MSGQLTGRERQLLAAVRQVLDPPRAAPGHLFGRRDAVLTRVAWLLGVLDAADADPGMTPAALLGHIEGLAARPLAYEPEPNDCFTKTKRSGHTGG